MGYHHVMLFWPAVVVFVLTMLYLLARRPKGWKQSVAAALCLASFVGFAYQTLAFVPDFGGDCKISYVEYQGERRKLPERYKRTQRMINYVRDTPLQLDPLGSKKKEGDNYYHIKVKTPDGRAIHYYVEETFDSGYMTCSRGVFLLPRVEARRFYRNAVEFFEF